MRRGLAHRTPVEIKLYDVRGRLVRTLVDETIGAGVHSRMWRGRNNQGNGVASGVYFMVFRAEDLVEKSKLLMLK